MIYASVVAVVAVVVLTYFGWKLTARSAYESAEYTVLDSAGPFETREYPDLMMATTNTQFESQGDDGSFMLLTEPLLVGSMWVRVHFTRVPSSMC